MFSDLLQQIDATVGEKDVINVPHHLSVWRNANSEFCAHPIVQTFSDTEGKLRKRVHEIESIFESSKTIEKRNKPSVQTNSFYFWMTPTKTTCRTGSRPARGTSAPPKDPLYSTYSCLLAPSLWRNEIVEWKGSVWYHFCRYGKRTPKHPETCETQTCWTKLLPAATQVCCPEWHPQFRWMILDPKSKTDPSRTATAKVIVLLSCYVYIFAIMVTKADRLLASVSVPNVANVCVFSSYQNWKKEERWSQNFYLLLPVWASCPSNHSAIPQKPLLWRLV